MDLIYSKKLYKIKFFFIVINNIEFKDRVNRTYEL